RREEVERRNKLDNLCYQLDKQLSENKEKIGEPIASELTALIKEGRDAVEKQDDAQVTAVTEKLEKRAQELAAKLYESAPAGAPGAPRGHAAPGAGDAGKKDDVIDAEFE